MKKESKKINEFNEEFKYYVYSPNEINKGMTAIVFLHGIGERGANLNDIEKYALPKYMNIFDIPFIVIAPQCHDNNFWDYHLREVEKMIDAEQKEYNFDKENIFLCGYSMGAFGAWNYLIERPELFKGIVSVSGGIMLPIQYNLDIIKDKPMLMYHGEKDDIVDVENSLIAYEKLKQNNASDIELKLLPYANHFLSDDVFQDQYMYDWLKQKSKTKKKTIK